MFNEFIIEYNKRDADTICFKKVKINNKKSIGENKKCIKMCNAGMEFELNTFTTGNIFKDSLDSELKI